MLEYPEIRQDYASYASIRDSNCIGYTCLTSNDIESYIMGVQNQKTESLYRQVLPQEINESIDEEDERYRRFKEIFDDGLRRQRKDALEHGLFKVFRKQIWTAYLMSVIGNLCHCATPILLYYIYVNIYNHAYQSAPNRLLVFIVVACRLIRVYCGYYGQILQNQAGVKIYRLIANAITKKTFLCSPLTNKKISVTHLNKMMDTDCSILLIYPNKLVYFIENILCFVILSALVIYVSAWPGVIGIGLVATNLIFRFLFKRIINNMDKELVVVTNKRIKTTIEVFNIIKFIKANALECCYFNKLRDIRLEEVTQLKEKLFLEMVQNIIVMISKPIIVVIVVKLVIIFGMKLDAQLVFTVNLAMIIINMQAILNAMAYIDLIQVALDNVQEFLQQEQMDLSHVRTTTDSSSAIAIKIEGSFYWDNPQAIAQGEDKEMNEGPQPPNTDEDKDGNHLKNIDLNIKRGELVTLIGSYGSGKTSLVNCLLGQMRKEGKPIVQAHGTIAYASQVAWIMNDTIRNNILFGKDYNSKRYAEAIKYASLEPDLHLFANGDLEIIGKRGSTLSGGQKARVSLARALYADADIYILDDILSAVDAHVGAFLFSMTINKYLKDKTVLLITHSLYFVAHADRVILFEKGQIMSSGSYDEIKDSPLLKKIEASQLRTSKDYEVIFRNKVEFVEPEDAKVKIAAIQTTEQFNTFDSFKIYIRRNSGTRFAVVISLFIIFLSLVTTYTNINLNSWAMSPAHRSNIYLYIQLGLNGVKVVITLSLAKILMESKLFQSTHDDMIKSLLFSPLSYFEKTPSQKIINRLSNDLNINDKIITTQFGFMLVNLQLFLSNLLGIIFVYFLFGKWFYLIFFIVVVGVALYFLKSYFELSIRVNKMDSELIIPLNSKYSEMLDGLPTIRAYRKVTQVINNFWQKMNIYSMAALVRQIVDGKLKLMMLATTNFLACIQILSLLFLNTNFGTYTVFIIFNFFALEDCIIRFYVSLNAFAPRLQALAKCQQLTDLEPEAGFVAFLDKYSKEDDKFQKIYFGAQIFPRGEINFDNYCLRYKPESDDVLKHLSLTIHPGEKIGIVGRTGSGKSTMMLGLLRILEAAEGRIIIDGKDISKLSLEELRSNINIILQDHFMFTGTVRENVDPTGSHTDEQIEKALQLCGIWDSFKEKDGVSTQVVEGGDNLSAGQKQLLNITRSLLNPKRIVLIDQATANIDFETDSKIQKVIRSEFADKTVLTIAHRINTVVNCDRILVLSKGEIAEFDSPSRLLERQDSVFARLYKESGKMKDQDDLM